ncbi:MAG: Na/Pi cotransporter family protein [Eubacteriales bacterium]|nr:Na/Pi cotransporter family protein [Eubacteriales bacterium]
MQILLQVFTFLGGFGMFIYGMNTMADGLQKSAGSKLKELLNLLTKNKLLGVVVGALITALIQSSSATTVMAVGFVNAGLMNLSQVVGVIMGANIGTTITAWIVSSSEWFKVLNPENLAPLAIGIGSILIFFTKSEKKKLIGEIIVGFGLIFIGLDLMKNVITPYRDSEIFKSAFVILGQNAILGVLAGAVVTAVVQSSSASVGILQTLAMSGLVPTNAAIYIILGQNIGTTVTAMLSSVGAGKNGKRAAMIHLLFNVVGSVVFVIGTVVFFGWVRPDLGGDLINGSEISLFHTSFNIINTVMLYPFSGLLVRIAEKLIPGEDEKDDSVELVHLDDRILESPSFAIQSAIKEVGNMGEYILGSLSYATLDLIQQKAEYVSQNNKRKENTAKYYHLITQYLVKIGNLSISEHQKMMVNDLFSAAIDLESIGDHANDISDIAGEAAKVDANFSEKAIEDISVMFEKVVEIVELALKLRETNTYSYIAKIEDLEEEIDELEEVIRADHTERLIAGICDIRLSILFLDTVSHLERISDHALKMAYSVKEEILN